MKSQISYSLNPLLHVLGCLVGMQASSLFEAGSCERDWFLMFILQRTIILYYKSYHIISFYLLYIWYIILYLKD